MTDSGNFSNQLVFVKCWKDNCWIGKPYLRQSVYQKAKAFMYIAFITCMSVEHINIEAIRLMDLSYVVNADTCFQVYIITFWMWKNYINRNYRNELLYLQSRFFSCLITLTVASWHDWPWCHPGTRCHRWSCRCPDWAWRTSSAGLPQTPPAQSHLCSRSVPSVHHVTRQNLSPTTIKSVSQYYHHHAPRHSCVI